MHISGWIGILYVSRSGKHSVLRKATSVIPFPAQNPRQDSLYVIQFE
jgi:hypothetical protein